MNILLDTGMDFVSIHFMLFLPLVVAAYFVVPARLKRPWLLLASYYFYFFAAREYLPVLILGTVFSYFFARLIGGAKTAKSRKVLLLLGILGQLGLLLFFKYNAFFRIFLSPLLSKLGVNLSPDGAKAAAAYFISAKALGISYYTFTALGYFIDVSEQRVQAEKNFITHALFMGFFPSVSMGPINRAGSLLPQLNDTSRKFDPAMAASALRTMAVGFFKKMCVADTLAVFTQSVFASTENLATARGFTLIFALLAFTLQLYFDFAGYTDIAVGTARLLGINIPHNFNLPFFATNFSGFWQRWHISLSSWLQDYVFMPLVWSRWPEKLPFLKKHFAKKEHVNPPVLSAIFVVFVISGLWHGDTLCFLFWGILQAVFRISEELLHRFYGKPQKRPSLKSRIGKTAVVFVLWSQSLMFFRVGLIDGGTISLAAKSLLNQFSFFGAGSLSSFFSSFYYSVYYSVYSHPLITTGFIVFCLACLAAALWSDWYAFAHLKGKAFEASIATFKPAAKYCIYFVLVICCLAAFILQSGGFGGANFIYKGF